MLENKRLDIMGFVASLDIGSEKMVMALGEKSGSDCRLVGVISISFRVQYSNTISRPDL